MSKIPTGFCQCGCGQKTNLARQRNDKLGYVAGTPCRFVRHHHCYKGGQKLTWDGRVIISLHTPGSHERVLEYEHRLIAAKALGHPIPGSIPVHHHPKFPSDQLVICQDQAYHLLLHRRYRAYKTCGHADWRKCWICKKWDHPKNLHLKPKREAYHVKCKTKYEHDRFLLRRE